MTRRIEMHICAHYVPARVRFLVTVLDAILGWRDCAVEAVVTSNVDALQTEAFWRPMKERFERAGHQLRLNVVSDLADPFTLTWEHKRFVQPWLDKTTSDEDLFIYVEDDIEITGVNLDYFVRTLKTTQKRGLIPGFLRYEKKDGERRFVDIMSIEYWNLDKSVTIDGVTFHACLNPYWAGFILNRGLAREYVASRSFSLGESQRVIHWATRERAAMGLTYERPDPRLRTRIVIPMVDGAPDPDCFLWHCADNYTAMNHPLMGQIRVEDGFQRESLAHLVARKARSARRRLLQRA
jgi:hypothetical protein